MRIKSQSKNNTLYQPQKNTALLPELLQVKAIHQGFGESEWQKIRVTVDQQNSIKLFPETCFENQISWFQNGSVLSVVVTGLNKPFDKIALYSVTGQCLKIQNCKPQNDVFYTEFDITLIKPDFYLVVLSGSEMKVSAKVEVKKL